MGDILTVWLPMHVLHWLTCRLVMEFDTEAFGTVVQVSS